MNEVELNTSSAHYVLSKYLTFVDNVCVKFVPKLLTMEQKQLCLGVTQDILNSANNNPDFLTSEL